MKIKLDHTAAYWNDKPKVPIWITNTRSIHATDLRFLRFTCILDKMGTPDEKCIIHINLERGGR